MNTTVTVIMPSLNVVNYIDESLQSVINQTLTNMEILCIDAGSTDGTLEIIEKYSKKDSRIKLVHSDVKSYGYQVNMGIEMSRGEYVAILETDDYIAPDMYRSLYLDAKKHNLDVSKSDFYYRVDNELGHYLKESHICSSIDIEYGKRYSYSDIPKLVLFDSGIWKGIYRKAFLVKNKIELNNSYGAAYQDIDFLIQVFYGNPSIMYTKDPLYFYRYSRGGASSFSKNVLKYIADEWLYLENRGLLENNSEKTQYAISRLVSCFVYEYNKLLDMCNYNMDDESIRNYFELLKNKTVEAIDNSQLISEMDVYETIKEMLDDNGGYVARRKAIMQDKKFKRRRIKQALTKKDIIIFGCGNYGKITRNILMSWNITPLCYTDNDCNLWGRSINGIDVIKPSEALMDFHGIVIIANKSAYDSIESRIMKAGFDKSSIVDARDIFETVSNSVY